MRRLRASSAEPFQQHGVPQGFGAWSPDTLEGPLHDRVDRRPHQLGKLSSTAALADYRMRVSVIIDREIR
jgi:hypothetical protein